MKEKNTREKQTPTRPLWGYIAALLFIIAIATSCRMGNYQIRIKKAPDPAKATIAALKSKDPNERLSSLKSLEKIIDKKAFLEDKSWIFTALSIIVKTDPVATIRQEAAYLLGKTAKPEAIDPLLEALEDKSDNVRLEALISIYRLLEKEKIKPSQNKEDKIRERLLEMVSSDPNVDIRIYSARLLKHFESKATLYGLISALKDRDFAVRYEAERSLIALTGKTFNYNAELWLRWLEDPNNKNPFKDKGKIPPQLIKPKRTFFGRIKDKIYQWYINWQGPAKPQ